MLSGVSAFTWARVYSICYPVGFVLLLLGAVDLGLAHSFFPPALLYFPAVLIISIAVVGVIGFFLRRRSELEAGYTTLYASANVDQLDHRTGQLIRHAGEPMLSAPGLFRRRDDHAIPIPAPPDAAAPAFPPRSLGSRVVSTGGSILIFAIVITAAALRGASHGAGLQGALTTLAWTIGLLLVVALAVFIGVRVTVARRVRRVSTLRPGVMIFTSTKTSDLIQGAVKLGVQLGPTGRFQVATTDADLELWDSDRDAPSLSVPWTEIVGLEPGKTWVGRTVFKSVDISVARDGQKVLLPFPIYGQQAFLAASSAWANQIFDEIQFHLAKP